jgi:hypothetical protein
MTRAARIDERRSVDVEACGNIGAAEEPTPTGSFPTARTGSVYQSRFAQTEIREGRQHVVGRPHDDGQ